MVQLHWFQNTDVYNFVFVNSELYLFCTLFPTYLMIYHKVNLSLHSSFKGDHFSISWFFITRYYFFLLGEENRLTILFLYLGTASVYSCVTLGSRDSQDSCFRSSDEDSSSGSSFVDPPAPRKKDRRFRGGQILLVKDTFE